jgi:hypothetical protein
MVAAYMAAECRISRIVLLNEAIDKGLFISEHVGQCNGAAKAARRTLLCCRSSSHRDMKSDLMKASNLWQGLLGTQ